LCSAYIPVTVHGVKRIILEELLSVTE